MESRLGATRYGKTFPSYVQFDRVGNVQRVGQHAKDDMAINPSLVVWGAKRLVGLTYKEAKKRGELGRFQYDVLEGPHGEIRIKTSSTGTHSPSEILKIIIEEILEDAANAEVNEPIAARYKRATIGVPAYFTAVRTGHIKEVATHAGFEEVETVAEPTAAALSYSLTLPDEERRESKLIVFDMGAGTLDVTIVQLLEEGGESAVGEIAIAGDEWLGGIDMDDLITTYMIDRYALDQIKGDAGRKALLIEEVERAKISLTRREETEVLLPTKPVSLCRREIEEVLNPLLQRARKPISIALEKAGLGAEGLDHVLFVGGPTRMPCVRSAVRDELAEHGAREDLLAKIDAIDREGFPVSPMECVARGAALSAAGILQPMLARLSEGYGTTFPVQGHAAYYQEIVKENATYPTSRTLLLKYGDPRAKAVYVDLAVKRRDAESPSGNRYELLALQPLFVRPTGKAHLISLNLEVTDQREVVASLQQLGTELHVPYRSVDLLQGEQVELQEEHPPGKDDGGGAGRTLDVEPWSTHQLERMIQVASMALEMVPPQPTGAVKEASDALRAAVSQAVDVELTDPDFACPAIANGICGLIQSLFAANLIVQADRDQYLRDLGQIAGSLKR